MSYRIGLIGVGLIGEPLVRGLIRAHGADVVVHLSPRNAARAQRLAGEFANVRIAPANQAVLDQSDWVILALLGDVAETIVRQLVFRPDQRVVSLIATASQADVQDWTGLTAVTRLVPLPFVADCVGPLAVFPLTADVTQLFGRLGALAPAEDEAGLELMSTITSMQSAFFAIVGQVVAWSVDHGLGGHSASQFTRDFFAALLSKAGQLSPDDLVEHWREMTPGGLNQAAMTQLLADDAIAAWARAMDAVQTRRGWDRGTLDQGDGTVSRLG